MGMQGGCGFLSPLYKLGRLGGSFGVDERKPDRQGAKNLECVLGIASLTCFEYERQICLNPCMQENDVDKKRGEIWEWESGSGRIPVAHKRKAEGVR